MQAGQKTWRNLPVSTENMLRADKKKINHIQTVIAPTAMVSVVPMRGRVGLNLRGPWLVILAISSAAAVRVLRVTETLLVRRTGSHVNTIITIVIVGIIIVIIVTEALLHLKTEMRNRETVIARPKVHDC